MLLALLTSFPRASPRVFGVMGFSLHACWHVWEWVWAMQSQLLVTLSVEVAVDLVRAQQQR